MHKKTVRLTSERLIGTNHLAPGTTVTLGDREADALIRQGHAVPAAFDEDAVIPPPRKREMVGAEAATAALAPAPRKAARMIAGPAQ